MCVYEIKSVMKGRGGRKDRGIWLWKNFKRRKTKQKRERKKKIETRFQGVAYTHTHTHTHTHMHFLSPPQSQLEGSFEQQKLISYIFPFLSFSFTFLECVISIKVYFKYFLTTSTIGCGCLCKNFSKPSNFHITFSEHFEGHHLAKKTSIQTMFSNL